MPLLIVGAIGLVALTAGAAAAIMIVLMNRGGLSPSAPATDAPAAAEAPVSQAPAAAGAPLEAPPGAPPDTLAPSAAEAGQAAPDAPAADADVEAGSARAARTSAKRTAAAAEGSRPGARLGSRLGGLAEAPPPAPMPLRVGGQILAPRKTRNVQPVYPQIAQSARVQGRVIIEATIDREGRVADARMLRSIPLLDQAALDAVRQWEYEPTLLNGVTVPVIMTVTVTFSLER